MLAHCLALIDAAGPACVAAKPQLACFERLGFPGWLALEATVALRARAGAARDRRRQARRLPRQRARLRAGGLRRASTRRSAPIAGLGADAVTQNPLLGRDALAPFVEGAGAAGAGVFVLVRTSNPGAADLFDAELAERRAAVGADRGAGRRGRHAGPGVGPQRGRRGRPARPRRSTSSGCAS